MPFGKYFTVIALTALKFFNGPIAGIVIGTHLIASIRKTTAWLKNPQPGKPTGLWTVVNLGLVWILFAFTSFGVQMIHRRVPEAEKMVSRETPLSAVAFLDSLEKKMIWSNWQSI